MVDLVYNKAPLMSCTIDVTEACNLACTYCFTCGKTNKKLSLDMGKKIIDFFFEHADPNADHYEISFWGGEPLLEYALIKELIFYAKRKSDKVIFGGTTNGILFDEEKLEFLGENKAKMMVSVDGVKEVHDKYRIFPNGSGSWDLVIKKIKLALKYWPDLHIRFSLTPELAPKLYKAMLFFWEELGVDWIAFSPVYECEWRDDDYKILEEEYIKILEYMRKNPQKYCLHLSDPGKGIWQDYPCGAGRSYVGFSVDGYIYPCHRFHKYGEEHEEQNKKVRIGSIWEGFYPERQKFLDYPVIRKHQCKDGLGCDIYNFCAGGCYAVTFDFTGDIFRMFEPMCKHQQLLFRVASKFKREDSQVPDGPPCVCFNACYLENTDKEIKNYNPSYGFVCVCFNTTYTGSKQDQWRPLINV